MDAVEDDEEEREKEPSIVSNLERSNGVQLIRLIDGRTTEPPPGGDGRGEGKARSQSSIPLVYVGGLAPN